jgi:hypothetical protein
MAKRALLSVTISAAAALTLSLFAACGGNNALPTADGGKPDGTTGPEAGAPEVSLPDVIGSPDVGLPDGSIYPHGTQLTASATVVLQGVTSDGYVIYTDNATNALYAISLTASGTPQPTTIAPLTASGNFIVNVTGAVVSFWNPVNMSTVIGPLSIWTSAHGVQAVATLSQGPNFNQGQQPGAVFAVSADSSHVLFFDNVSGVTGDLYVAATDGTGKTKLINQTEVSDSNCYSTLTFGGAYAVAAYCGGMVVSTADSGAGDAGDGGADAEADAAADGGTADAVAPDAGTAQGIISTFTGPSWTLAAHLTDVQPAVTVDSAGTELLVSAPSGLLVYPIAGGAATLIDSASGSAGTLTSDGGATIYTTGANALKRSPVVAPLPVTLVPTGLAGLIALSNDNNWVQAFLNVDQSSGFTDLYLASAATTGSATLLGSAPAAVFGDAFTANSGYALYFANLDTDTGTGTFTAANCSAPGDAGGTVIGMDAWEDFASSGTKVVYNDNFMQGMGSGGQTADLKSVDVSAPVPTLLVSQADANFFLSPDKTKIIYTWTYETGSQAGLWVLPAP